MPAEVQHMTIHELRGLLRTRTISALDLVRAVYARIDATAETTNTFISLCREASEIAARAADQRIAAGRAGPLTGIPIAVKDNICMSGTAVTCGSRMLEHFHSPYDATVIERLRSGGAVIVGKTNMDEFAMGSSTETSFTGPCRNPWSLDLVAGGSSGGAAAAVVADQCSASLGTDTGGSIRQPASFCGVVGLKPTYGRVSRYGLVASASSLDQIGPLTKDVRDAAILLGAISGKDQRDSTSVDIPVPDFEDALSRDISGMRLGIPHEYFTGNLAPDVAAGIKEALAVFERGGALIQPISLPHTRYAVATYYLIATAEASSNLARYDGVAYGHRSPEYCDLPDMYERTRSEAFGTEVKRRIMLGTYALSAGYYDAYYQKATQVRRLIRQDFDQAFQQCDVIITPTAPDAAYRIGEKTSDPLNMYCDDMCTVAVNLAGLPALSVPCGFTAAGLPIGMQIIGNLFQESELLRCAHWYERQTEWNLHRPLLQ
jgi:aspartyl-tRNA(Asn)/glutamyl-tRNA(Gln) amidotransferase subunit A